mmetsp:Transcript_34864/g.68833  ORF Transcript_34864/g.68833 Transcript_34864/m.68833 type:complete len:217 (+) Transcript_34864:21-671(+)
MYNCSIAAAMHTEFQHIEHLLFSMNVFGCTSSYRLPGVITDGSGRCKYARRIRSSGWVLYMHPGHPPPSWHLESLLGLPKDIRRDKRTAMTPVDGPFSTLTGGFRCSTPSFSLRACCFFSFTKSGGIVEGSLVIQVQNHQTAALRNLRPRLLHLQLLLDPLRQAVSLVHRHVEPPLRVLPLRLAHIQFLRPHDLKRLLRVCLHRVIQVVDQGEEAR